MKERHEGWGTCSRGDSSTEYCEYCPSDWSLVTRISTYPGYSRQCQTGCGSVYLLSVRLAMGWYRWSLSGWYSWSVSCWYSWSVSGWYSWSLSGWYSWSLSGWYSWSLSGWYSWSLSGWVWIRIGSHCQDGYGLV